MAPNLKVNRLKILKEVDRNVETFGWLLIHVISISQKYPEETFSFRMGSRILKNDLLVPIWMSAVLSHKRGDLCSRQNRIKCKTFRPSKLHIHWRHLVRFKSIQRHIKACSNVHYHSPFIIWIFIRHIVNKRGLIFKRSPQRCLRISFDTLNKSLPIGLRWLLLKFLIWIFSYEKKRNIETPDCLFNHILIIIST